MKQARTVSLLPERPEILLHKATILLVDDDQLFRNEFIDCFDEYTIIEASEGETALKILEKPHEIDLVLLDIRLPGMDGFETLQRIKKTAPSLSVIILTGYSSKDSAIQALRTHADDYIEKPFDVSKTKDCLERVLSQRQTAQALHYSNQHDKVERVKRLVQRNIDKKVGLKDAADTVYLAPKYLSRIFKEQAGIGFNQYRLSLKVEETKQLLKNTQYTISQISDKLGYENPESCIRLFKKVTGITPAEYRRQSKHA